MQSITILGKPYDYKRVDCYDDEEQVGEYDPTICLITTLKSLTKDFEREKILHEIIHAIDDEMDLDLSDTQVKRLSIGLYAVYKENRLKFKFPWWYRWLIKP